MIGKRTLFLNANEEGYNDYFGVDDFWLVVYVGSAGIEPG
jgi:hypothetical protein